MQLRLCTRIVRSARQNCYFLVSEHFGKWWKFDEANSQHQCCFWRQRLWDMFWTQNCKTYTCCMWKSEIDLARKCFEANFWGWNDKIATIWTWYSWDVSPCHTEYEREIILTIWTLSFHWRTVTAEGIQGRGGGQTKSSRPITWGAPPPKHGGRSGRKRDCDILQKLGTRQINWGSYLSRHQGRLPGSGVTSGSRTRTSLRICRQRALGLNSGAGWGAGRAWESQVWGSGLRAPHSCLFYTAVSGDKHFEQSSFMDFSYPTNVKFYQCDVRCGNHQNRLFLG